MPNSNDRRRYNLRALSRGIVAGDTELLSAYLKQGGDPNAADRTGCTLLHEAANFDQADIVRMLLQAGAEVDRMDRDQRTPLDLVPNRPYRGPMTLATPGGLRSYSELPSADPKPPTLEVATLLLDSGAVIDRERGQRESWFLRTPLATACENGDTELVKLLLKRGANIDARDIFQSTPLIAAVNKGHLEVVELLIRSGADPNGADRRGQTPLLRSIYAAHRGDEENFWHISERLLRAGADPNLGTNDRGDTPIFAAINECRNDLLLKVMEAGGQIHHRNQRGDTALCFLVKTLHSRKLEEEKMLVLAQTLLDAGACKQELDAEGRCPANLAELHSFEKLQRLLED